MASYEEAAAAVAVDDVVSSFVGLDQSVQDSIQAILNDNATKGEGGQQEVIVQWYGTPNDTGKAATVITVPDGTETIQGPDGLEAPVVLFGAESPSLVADFDADSPVQAIMLNAKGGNEVTFASPDGVNVTLGGGRGDAITTAEGNDTVNYNGGSANINVGTGKDTVTVQGSGSNTQITQNDGTDSELTVMWNTDAAIVATVDGGNGFDRIQMKDGAGDRGDHSFEIVNGKLVMHSEGAITLENMEIITYDTDGNPNLLTGNDQMTIISQNVGDTLVARLYQIAYGRQPFDGYKAGTEGADQAAEALGGIKYWMETFKPEGDTADAQLQHLVYSFLNQDEFWTNDGQGYKEMTADGNYNDYVDALFGHLNEAAKLAGKAAVTEVNGRTAEQFAQAIENGDMNMYDVAWQLAASSAADEIMGADGLNYVIEPWNMDGQA